MRSPFVRCLISIIAGWTRQACTRSPMRPIEKAGNGWRRKDTYASNPAVGRHEKFRANGALIILALVLPPLCADSPPPLTSELDPRIESALQAFEVPSV